MCDDVDAGVAEPFYLGSQIKWLPFVVCWSDWMTAERRQGDEGTPFLSFFFVAIPNPLDLSFGRSPSLKTRSGSENPILWNPKNWVL